MLIGARSLFAQINSWEYNIDTELADEGLTGRHLLMIGETAEAHFLWASEINFEIMEVDGPLVYEIICHDDRTGSKYGDIRWLDYDTENKIPRFVQGGVRVSRGRFNHILELLLYKEQIENSKVLIMLKLFGIELGLCGIEDDKWPANKLVAITDMRLSLSKPISRNGFHQ